MKYPNFNEEKKLWRKGYKLVVGLDEAGRGPLAGPVFAAAVAINSKFPDGEAIDDPRCNRDKMQNSELKEVRDSKKLSPEKREEIFKLLKQSPEIEWGIGRVSEKVIDKINILEATKLAMIKAVRNLEKNLETKFLIGNLVSIDFLILDGNFKIKTKIPQKSIIKADEKVFSVAAASILAKVTRDRIMVRYHKKYPQYGFAQHKGYSTKMHRQKIKKYGFCRIHRKSFRVS